jgi:predicted TIM-barrel fold metal-dependent hydrolase
MREDDMAQPQETQAADTAPEAVIEPDLPIIDAHHHIWISGRRTQYPPAQIIADKATSGHNVVATVFVEAHEGYRAEGPEHLKAVGETEMACALAEEGLRQGARAAGVCAAMVVSVDLRGGELVGEAIEAHEAAAKGRLRGVRQLAAAAPELPVRRQPPLGLLLDPALHAGMRQLQDHGLSFDVMVMQSQLADAIALARAFPAVTLVLNHVGAPIGVGRYAEDRKASFDDWRKGLAAIAALPNVVCKLGGLYMPFTGLGPDPARQVSSQELAAAQGDHLRAAIDLFGPGRCMFESNFPVDLPWVSYVALWNGFKRVAAGFSRAERAALFHDTAARVYRIAL